RKLLAIHCGDHVELIGFGPAGPERVLHIDKHSGDPKLSWQPAPLMAADVNGDRRDDLLVGFAAADASGGPRGGALLEFVQNEDGSFAPPRLLAPLFVSALAVGALDANVGADVIALHREDSRLDRASQLIAFRGGPAPLKMFATDVASDVRSVFAIDLDLDGRDEVLLGAMKGPIELLHLGVHSEVAQRETLAASAIGTASLADLNGDGATDAIVAGAKLWALIATRDQAPTLQVLREPFDASHVVAVDHDGALELVALRADRVVVYASSAPLHFDREPLTIFGDRDFALDDLVVLHTNPPRLAVLGHTPARSDLVFLPLDSVNRRPTLLAEESTWSDAPLHLSFTVP
ncbi:MAG TPA: VCBS repeat-containing protein, partial [Polyangiales bacterium]|nr:VCBS repeat-containing protein [Polyangiales bacterium]